MGGANSNYRMRGNDGDEWMVFSDSMRMGQHNSIMDSSLVSNRYVLLFANSLAINWQKKEIRFDRWWAQIEEREREDFDLLLELRRNVLPKFHEAIKGRDLAIFP